MTFFDKLRLIAPASLSDNELSELGEEVWSKLAHEWPVLEKKSEETQNEAILSIVNGIFAKDRKYADLIVN
jgi:hypothetical protein